MKRNLLRVLILTAAVAGCDPVAPAGPLFIQNRTDAFDFELRDVIDFHDNLQYIWPHTGTVATVTRSRVLSSGLGAISVRDADHREVFTGSITERGEAETAEGRPGNWSVSVVVVGGTGTLEFTVRKR